MKNSIKKMFSYFQPRPVIIEGRWHGFYKYSDSYPEKIRVKRVQFTADITIEENFPGFIGTIKEEESGVPEIAGIKGDVNRSAIKFTKSYRNYYQLDEQGIRTLLKGPQFIYYSGIYDHSKKMYLGQWVTRSVTEYANGEKIISDTTGHWQMWRPSSNN